MTGRELRPILAAIVIGVLLPFHTLAIAAEPVADSDVTWTFERPRDELYVKSFNVESLNEMPDGSLAISGTMEPSGHTYLQLVAPTGETNWTRRIREREYEEGGPGVAFSVPLRGLDGSTTERLAVVSRGGDVRWFSRSDGRLLSLLKLQADADEYYELSSFAVATDGSLVVAGWSAKTDLVCGDGAYVARFDSAGRLLWHWNHPRHPWSFARSVAILPDGTIAVQVGDDPPPNVGWMGTMAYEECPDWRGTEVVLLSSSGEELSRVMLPGRLEGGAIAAVSTDKLAVFLYDRTRAASLLAVITIRHESSHQMNVTLHDLKDQLGDAGIDGEVEMAPLDADRVAARLGDSWLADISLDGKVQRLEPVGSHGNDARCTLALDGQSVACADTMRIVHHGFME